MAKNISSGIEQSKPNQTIKTSDQLRKQWREIRNRVDTILLSNNVLKTNDARSLCIELDSLSAEDRISYITKQWGPLYLKKIEPLLQQLDVLERLIAKLPED